MTKLQQNLLIFLICTISCSFGYAKNVNSNSNVIVNQVHYEHVVWNGIPINIQVPVGQERIIKFPGAVTFNNDDPRLTTDKVNMMQNNGFFYVRAKKSFAPIRLHFVSNKTGQSVLIDLSAREYASNSPIEVVIPNSQSGETSERSKAKSQSINYVTLFRYAIQNLYSPKRLVDKQPNISRAPMYTTRSVDLFDQQGVIAMPLVSWKGGQLYVTAVLLKNIWSKRIILDPRKINGNWLSSSFYPTNYVSKKGSKQDRTVIFLISDQPFNNALNTVKGYR